MAVWRTWARTWSYGLTTGDGLGDLNSPNNRCEGVREIEPELAVEHSVSNKGTLSSHHSTI